MGWRWWLSTEAGPDRAARGPNGRVGYRRDRLWPGLLVAAASWLLVHRGAGRSILAVHFPDCIPRASANGGAAVAS